MTVLVESGHINQYPYNHARILWNNVITSISATGAATGNPASAALTKTTYERWKPTASGDVLTGTFAAQEINSIAIAAHSDLTPTVEVLQGSTWEPITAFPFDGESLDAGFADGDYRLISYAPDNEAILFLIKPRICSGVRITVTYSGTAPTLGVLMAGQVLEMQRPFYSGHSPSLLSSQSTVRPNISESGEWLGASQIRQGRNVAMSWENLKAPWVRKNFMPFSEALLTNPFVAAWNPKRFPDAVYCSSSERPQPSNSGTLNYQNITLNARAYSDGTIPELQNLDAVTFDELFTFTRASAATEVGPSGQLREVATDVARFTHDPVTGEALGLLIEEERTNLLEYPRRFEGANYTPTNGATLKPSETPAPDGVLLAYDLMAVSASSYLSCEITTASASTNYTAFVFVAKGQSTEAEIIFRGLVAANQAIRFNTADGSIVFQDAGAFIEDYGTFWRVGATVEATGTTLDFRIVSDRSGANETVQIWHAQLEEGSFPTSVIVPDTTFTSRASTATYLDSTGTLQTAAVDEARDDAYGYDIDGILRSIGLLLEGASTNLFTYSEDLNGADWTISAGTITADDTAAPDDAVTADLWTSDNATSGHRGEQSFTLTSGNTYTLGGYVKENGVQFVQITIGGAFTSGNTYANFDIINGTVTTSAQGDGVLATIEPAKNGFYRIALTFDATASGTGNSSFSFVNNGTAGFAANYIGDGVKGAYVWGAQLEESPYATSYIPTAASTVTRSADVSSSPAATRAADDCVRTLGAEYNSEAGTLYVKVDARNGEVVATLGSVTITADTDGLKQYIATWTSDPSATELVLGEGKFEELEIYPQVTTLEEINA